MKLLALLIGILASVFVWTSPYLLGDMQPQFLALWPDSASQQLLALVTWHGLVASTLLGGLLAVFSPFVGAVILLGAAAAWAYLGTRLPAGFDLLLIVPLALSLIAAVAAFGAMVRGMMRRREAKRPVDDYELAREQALRLEPSVALRRALEEELRSSDASRAESAPLASDEPEGDDVDDIGSGPRAEPRRSHVSPAPRRENVREDRGAAGGGFLVALNTVLLVLLAGAVAFLAYVDYHSGALLSALGSSASVTAEAAVETGEPDSRMLEIATPLSSEVEPDSAEPVPAAGPEQRAAQSDQVRVTTTPIETAMVVPARSWSDPFAYCAAVDTVDFPDNRYDGPTVVDAIAQALAVPSSSSPDRVRWRCVSGAVVACAAFNWPVCALTPSIEEMVAYCASHPNAQSLQAPNGRWNCRGTNPEVPQGESWPVDARGFLPSAWITVPAPLDAGTPANP